MHLATAARVGGVSASCFETFPQRAGSACSPWEFLISGCCNVDGRISMYRSGCVRVAATECEREFRRVSATPPPPAVTCSSVMGGLIVSACWVTCCLSLHLSATPPPPSSPPAPPHQLHQLTLLLPFPRKSALLSAPL